MAINISDGTGAIISACTVNKTSTGTLLSVSGTTTAQTTSDSGLTCNTGYTYNITCTDAAGNVNSSLATFTTSACSAASSSSGGGSSSATPSELATGFTKTLWVGELVSFKAENKSHVFILLKIKNNTADVQLSSIPIKATLAVGESKKFDLNGDGTYEILVKLNSLTGISKADVTLTSISETITTTPAAPETTTGATTDAGTPSTGDSSDATQKTGSLLWLWIIIILVIIAVIVFIIYQRRK